MTSEQTERMSEAAPPIETKRGLSRMHASFQPSSLNAERCENALNYIAHLESDLTEAHSQLAAAREGLRKIHNCGQSIEPDHWKFRCMARDVARDTLSRLWPSPKQGAAEGRVRYTDDMTVWFIDDRNMTLQGQVHSWNEEYAIIDTNEDRYTVQHEHVFTHSPTADEVQAALTAQHPKAGEGDTND